MPRGKQGRDWSPEDDATLTRLWLEHTPMKLILDQLPDRTYAAIAKRRGKLNLPLRSGPNAPAGAHPVMQKLWLTLKKRRATRAQLEERSGACHSTVNKFIQLFRAQMHVCGWLRSPVTGALVEVFKAGAGKDVPKPPRLTSAERCRRWWQKCKRERPLDAGRRIARDNALRQERSGKLVRRDVAAIALFGPAARGDDA